MGPSYRVVLRSGPTPGKLFPLEKPEMFIGRDLSNDVVINDPEISRRHSRLFRQSDGYSVEDMGSTNGTSVNGQRLAGPYLLRPGDVLTFGERVTLVFEVVEPAGGDATISAANQMPEPTYQQVPAPVPPPAYPQSYQPNVYEAPPPVQQTYNPPAPVQNMRQAPPPYNMPVQQMPVQAPPQQMTYQAPQPVYEPVPPAFANQVPLNNAPLYDAPKAKLPIWPFIIIGILLVIILVLVIDDFRLWCPLFGMCS